MRADDGLNSRKVIYVMSSSWINCRDGKTIVSRPDSVEEALALCGKSCRRGGKSRNSALSTSSSSSHHSSP